MNTSLFSNTPSITVFDNRGLTVRDISYHRHPDTPAVTDERITRHRYNPQGFLTQSADPRLHAASLANFTWLTDLAGNVLRTQGADAGTTIVLNDAAERPVITVSNIRTASDSTEDHSQAVTRTFEYEGDDLPGRPLSVAEAMTDGITRITERFVYAGNSDAEQALNLAGQCVSHYDTSGLIQTDSIALTGVSLSVTRHLLKDADNPNTVADWQGDNASAWDDLLDEETYVTLTTADATGTVLTTTDAQGNVQRVAYDVTGMLCRSWLTLKDGTDQFIVTSLTYSAAGQKLREVHGNGVVTTYTYEPETQRLTGIKTERPSGHATGEKVLQDLRYSYDPVGNLLKVRNDAQATRFWRNQKIVPESTYAYDSLYQLVSATGREMANAAQQGSSLPPVTVPLPVDSSAYTNYSRTYTYDAAGNLMQIRHSAPATNHNYTTDLTISDRSNRGVLSTLTTNPSDVDRLFMAGGQQKQLQPGQQLNWTPRNELLKVTPVVRDGNTDDRESYRYNGDSQRILKVSVHKTGSSTRTQRVIYLPELELRTTSTGETEKESLQVIRVGEAGRAQVRVHHWESGKPDEISNDQARWSYDNLTGSSGIELDAVGNVISMEEYYPYGGAAVWTARSAVEADYKTVRYSGKELDATGLYYYSYRYYQPWAGRWLSADPAGTVDGLNLYRMCRNSPVTFCDIDGHIPTHPASSGRADILKAWDFSHLSLPESSEPEHYKFIVHMAPVEHLINREGIFSSNANEEIKSWDAISASLITEQKNSTYRAFGAILDVPYQNILAAHSEDLMIELNAGKSNRTEYLTRVFDKAQEMSSLEKSLSYVRNGMLAREIQNYQRRLSKPEEVLQNTYDSRNEIVIATRPFVNITEGLPATGEVKIKGYLLMTGQHSSFAIKYPPKDNVELTSQDNLLLENAYARDIAQAAGVPLYRISGRPDAYDYMNSASINRLRRNNT